MRHPILDDEPLLSPQRVWQGFRLWLYLQLREVDIPLGHMLWYHRRPHARYFAGKDGAFDTRLAMRPEDKYAAMIAIVVLCGTLLVMLALLAIVLVGTGTL